MLLLSNNGRMEAQGGDDAKAVANGNGTTSSSTTSTIENDRERHAQFVAALDNLPDESLGNTRGMEQLAATLGWTRRETEDHAYRYFAALSEISEEEYGTERLRERRQTDYLKRANSGNPPGSWTAAENRMLQTLLATLAARDGEESVNILARLNRFFPERTEEQIQRQIEYLCQRRRVEESMER